MKKLLNPICSIKNQVSRIKYFGSILFVLLVILVNPQNTHAQTPYWEIQSIDTMKYSRDMARERNKDMVFEKIIESVVEKIASTGATHVAIGTPYDEEFLPFLQTWVIAARKENLNVWFRGNFSGWEGWFDYPLMTVDEHKIKTGEFIIKNPQLFEDGDIFTSCTECENGRLGDPRQTGDLDEFRDFLISEYDLSARAFDRIEKKVKTGYFSMNADVSRIVMDKETTSKLGGIVVIDHYVKDPAGLASDVDEISSISGGKVVLGEMGVPIPDIHGPMSNREQEEWIIEALSHLSKSENLIGINYWVSFGGSTAIWNNDGSEKPAVAVLRSYFLPNILSGMVVNELGRPINNALVIADSKQTNTNNKGEFKMTANPSLDRIVINAQSYKDKVEEFIEGDGVNEIVLEKEKEGLFFKLQKYIFNIIRNIRIK